MLSVEIKNGLIKCNLINQSPIIAGDLWDEIEDILGVDRADYYFLHNGRLMHETDLCDDYISIVPRLVGGKGGYGSLLRAKGAQIQKTTNRVACRDLNGRRLRYVNEERRLRAWVEKQSKRKEEEEERKKRKLEKLCAEPKHEFNDPRYEQERSELAERLGDAVEQGFKAAVTSGKRRKLDVKVKLHKRKMMIDLDIDSDEFNTSDDSDSDITSLRKKCRTVQQSLNDSGHSSDDNGKIHENSKLKRMRGDVNWL